MNSQRRLLATAAAAACLGACASNRDRIELPPAAVTQAVTVDLAGTAERAQMAAAAILAPEHMPPGPSALVEAIANARLAQVPDDGAAGEEVVSTAPRVLSENQLVGAYAQPEWTTRRRWARTRAYVLPEGQIEFEQWYRGTYDDGEGPSHLWQTEISFGLPNRFQVDLYANNESEDGSTKWVGLQPEMRYAFGDWGEIPLNPTLYLEYKWLHHAADVAEGKLLLAEEVTPELHWGMNFSVEQELDGEHACELAVTQVISYTIADSQFSVGVEFEYDHVTVRGGRDHPEHEVYLGPSLQWRPTESTHLDIVPLFGMEDAHDYRLFIIFGIDFGGRVERPSGPVISRSR